MDLSQEAIKLHSKLKGKLSVESKVQLKSTLDLSLAYTPGVAEPCREIARDKSRVFDYTIKGNSVAVVSDGSAVLGLGDIGPEAALPVMEGKALLFKELAGVDAFPICLDTKDVEEIVKAVKLISPVFGGINLEDISAPRCFAIEEKLQGLGIPVFHDDQHGTAVVVLAALLNASKVVGKELGDLKIVISGAGAGGIAISRMLLCIGIDAKLCTSAKSISLADSRGLIYNGREHMNKYKESIAQLTNKGKLKGSLADAMKGADVFIGVSRAGLVDKAMVQSMAEDSIVFAMANPVPEIMPDKALEAGAAVVGTGRSDFPNQINNVLGFPGIFRGALDANAMRINNAMKIAAAHALAGCVEDPSAEKVLPSPLDRDATVAVAKAVKKTAIETGVTR